MALSAVDAILYILLGSVAGVIYSLRKILILERKIDRLDRGIIKIVQKIEREEREELRILRGRKTIKKRITRRRKR